MFKFTLPNASSQYGAQMGRNNVLPCNTEIDIKLHLNRLPFVDGAYDKWGAYWGSPANVWCATGEHEDFDYTIYLFVRANSREEAKEAVKETLPNARFYR